MESQELAKQFSGEWEAAKFVDIATTSRLGVVAEAGKNKCEAAKKGI